MVKNLPAPRILLVIPVHGHRPTLGRVGRGQIQGFDSNAATTGQQFNSDDSQNASNCQRLARLPTPFPLRHPRWPATATSPCE